MPLPSFFQRFMKPSTPAAAAPGKGRRASAAGPGEPVGPTAAVEAARVQARRRLVGALVLLLAGIVGFPLLFETQPRPVALDMPIQTPGGGAQVPPPALPAPATAQRQPLPPSVQAAAEVEVETPLDKAQVAASDAVQTVPAMKTELRSEAKPEPKPEPKPSAPKAVAEPTKAAASKAVSKPAADDGSRARALLDDKPTPVAAASAAASSAKAGRFVVQVGAYTEAGALREARQKVEKLGMKTYTQVIEGDAGKRTRVRVGPFETREEAERTAARVKAQGLPTAILAL